MKGLDVNLCSRVYQGALNSLRVYARRCEHFACSLVPMVGICCKTLSLDLDDRARVVSVRSLDSGYEFLSAQSVPVGLWQMGIMRNVTYKDPLPPIKIPSVKYEGHEWFANRDEYCSDLAIDCDALPAPDIFTNRGNVILKWPIPVPGGTGTVVVSIAGGERDRLEFRSRVSLPDGWALKRFSFPRIRGLGDRANPGEDALLYPETWGVLRSNPLEDMTSYCGQYPSHANWCQMTAWLHQDNGLYIGILDPNSSHTGIDMQYVQGGEPAPMGADKRFLQEGKRTPAPAVRTPLSARLAANLSPAMQLRCHHWPIMTNEWICPYPVVLKGFTGSWYDAARIHREWATQQRWCRRGRLADRKDASAALAGIDLWFCKYGFPPWSSEPAPATDFQEAVDRLQDTFQMPFGVHWYHWHAFNWHTRFPDHNPPVDGFADVVRRLQDEGIVLMPYCQGRLLYRDRPTFESERTHASIGDKGQPYMEQYTFRDDWPLALCPGEPWCRQQWVATARMLWRDYGVDGVYFDQITSMPPSLCYHAGHMHPPGGGEHWWKGYDQLLGDLAPIIRENPRRFVSSELMADAYLDRIDLYMTFVPPLEDYVPLHPAIYSGYTTVMGRSTPVETMADMQWLVLIQGEQMLFGGQLGWMTDEILNFPQAVSYVRNLARLRSQIRKFLHFGQMEAPLDLMQDERLKVMIPANWAMKERPVLIDRPAVRNTVWRSPDGESLVLLLNEVGRDVAVKLELPQTESMLEWQVLRLGKSDPVPVTMDASDLEIALGGYEMVALIGVRR